MKFDPNGNEEICERNKYKYCQAKKSKGHLKGFNMWDYLQNSKCMKQNEKNSKWMKEKNASNKTDK